MKLERMAQLMELERECVLRQGSTDCPRNVDPIRGCYGCNLLVEDGGEIVEAYDNIIAMLKGLQTLRDCVKEQEKEDNE